MAQFRIYIAPVAMYQAQPFDIHWVIAGSDPALDGSATVRFIVNGQTIWSKVVALPMTDASVDRVNCPSASLAAHRLYDIPPGTIPPNSVLSGIVAEINAGGQISTAETRAQVHVYPLIPIVEWGGPLVPGQPASLPWGFDTTAATEPTVVGSYATAAIGFEIQNESGEFVLLQPQSPAAYVQLGGMQYRSPLTLIPKDARSAQLLFKIGSHRIRATIALTALGFSQSWSVEGTIVVVAQPPSADWWRWTLPLGLSTSPGYLSALAGWNSPYRIGGRFVNRSAYAVLEANLALQQTDLWGELPVPEGPLTEVATQTLAAPILPNEDDALGDVTFPEQKQNYVWLNQLTSSFSPSVASMVVSYFTFMTVRDPFGNTYPPIRSEEISVNVSVQKSKLAQATAGMVTIIAALVLQVAAFGALIIGGPWGLVVGGILGGAAAIAFFTATQLVKNAMDPPTPNFEYRTLIANSPSHYVDASADDVVNGGGLKRFLRLLQSIAKSYETRSEIVGRLLGAQVDRNAEGLQLQHAAYLLVHEQLARDVESIPINARAASREMLTLLRPDGRVSGQATLLEWTVAGLPESAKGLLTSADGGGIPREVVDQLEVAGRSQEIAASAIKMLVEPDDGTLERSVAALAVTFLEVGNTTVAEAESMLAQARASMAPV